MDTILLFKQDLDTYPTGSLRVLQRHLGLPAAGKDDLVWLLAIHQAQNDDRPSTGRLIKAARATMNGKPTLYLVAGAPGAGKSTAVKHLVESGIVPQDAVDIDRDKITEENTDFDQKLQEIHDKYGHNPEVVEIEIHRMMSDAFNATTQLYKDAIMTAVENQQDFLTYMPPFMTRKLVDFSEGVMKDYNIVLIFIDTDPEVAYERTQSRAQRQKWLRLNTVDVYCSWSETIKAVKEYCLSGKCYICDNRGEEIKCLNFEDYRRELPSYDQAAGMCKRETRRVLNQRKQVRQEEQRRTESVEEEEAIEGYY